MAMQADSSEDVAKPHLGLHNTLTILPGVSRAPRLNINLLQHALCTASMQIWSMKVQFILLNVKPQGTRGAKMDDPKA